MSNLHRLFVSNLTDSYSLNLETKSSVFQDIVLTSLMSTLPYRLKKKGGGALWFVRNGMSWKEKPSLSLCNKSCIMFINSCSTKCMNNKRFMQVQIFFKIFRKLLKMKGKWRTTPLATLKGFQYCLLQFYSCVGFLKYVWCLFVFDVTLPFWKQFFNCCSLLKFEMVGLRW